MMIEPNVYQAMTLRAAIKLYARFGMKPNRAYTPTAMLATAGRLTGKTFKRGQFQAAHDALSELLEMPKVQLTK